MADGYPLDMKKHPLQVAREAAELGQKELAELAKVPQPQISHVESGKRARFGRVPAARLVAVLRARGVSIDIEDLTATPEERAEVARILRPPRARRTVAA